MKDGPCYTILELIFVSPLGIQFGVCFFTDDYECQLELVLDAFLLKLCFYFRKSQVDSLDFYFSDCPSLGVAHAVSEKYNSLRIASAYAEEVFQGLGHQ